MNPKVDFHSGTRAKRRSLQTPSRYPGCSYANKTLINCCPEHQWEGSSKQYEFSLKLHPIAHASGYQDLVAKLIMRCRFKRTLLGSSPRVNINCEMQVHPSDESRIG
ncbi:unnamed protein product [Schistosoma spindalis]|nr:unnamed protein product [Schistosoma spindale]